jgi:hypothetical protein
MLSPSRSYLDLFFHPSGPPANADKHHYSAMKLESDCIPMKNISEDYLVYRLLLCTYSLFLPADIYGSMIFIIMLQ